MPRKKDEPESIGIVFGVCAIFVIAFVMSLGWLGWSGFKYWQLARLASNSVEVQALVVEANHHQSTRMHDGDQVETNTYKLKASFTHADGSSVTGEREVSPELFSKYRDAKAEAPMPTVILSDPSSPTRWNFKERVEEGIDLTKQLVFFAISLVGAAVSCGVCMHLKRKHAAA